MYPDLTNLLMITEAKFEKYFRSGYPRKYT